MGKLKIIHITGVRELGAGQRKQLEYEQKSACFMSDVEWNTLAIHSGKILNDFEIKTPRVFDFLFVRNIFFWILVIKKSRKYDLVLFRHITFDPFVFIFAPLVVNRLSVHHSKEIEELKLIREGWKGKLSSRLEKISGRFSLKRVLGIVGVTNEIASYENSERGLCKKTLVYPNGIDVDSIAVANDRRETNVINIVFICSYFSEWHGLDILLNSINKINCLQDFNIHLIGHLTEQQKHDIQINKYSSNVICYGSLDSNQYREVISKCDIALGSLAMFRQNLHEGSTLKVREMLAMGIPIYSGHKDTSIPNSFKYYLYEKEINFHRLIEFALRNKAVQRESIRQTAMPYIDKNNIMKCLIQDIKNMGIL